MRACCESVERLDDELARLARGAGKLGYALGVGLEALARTGGHHDLGFSSVEAYALERCERRARWIQETRGLARRLGSLPALRDALVTGVIGFSMAQILAKVAQPEDEAAWLAEARVHTVRQMRKRVEARRQREGEGGSERDHATEDGDLRTLTVTVDQEDAWLFECTRMIVGHVAGTTLGDTVEALIGEGTTSLLETLGASPPGTPASADFEPFGEEPEDSRQREWEAECARWREEAEDRCERDFFVGEADTGAAIDAAAADGPFEGGSAGHGLVEPGVADRRVAPGPTFDGDATAIDAELRRVAGELAVRDLEIGRLAEAFWRADGWRRLGYATGAQYARERLGTSLSWVKGKRALARRVAALPGLDAAIRSRALGYEAACLVASVATPDTLEVWVERASERTVKHLREEVSAVQMLARLGATSGSTSAASSTHTSAGGALASGSSGRGTLWPPSEETTEAVAALESHIVSGAVFGDQESASQKSAGLSERGQPEGSVGAEPSCLLQLSTAVARMLERLEPRDRGPVGDVPGAFGAPGRPSLARRPSRRDRARGRVTLRLRVSAGTRDYYRWLERLFVRHGPRQTSFLRFLCVSLVGAWRQALGADVAYARVYARDRYRCTSPVCSRRDVTPHHLKLRSAGGDDSLENLTSLCAWCHLEGIHGGRMGAAPPAERATWVFGRPGHQHTVVRGRRRELARGRRARSAVRASARAAAPGP